jgi:hypothetical protein
MSFEQPEHNEATSSPEGDKDCGIPVRVTNASAQAIEQELADFINQHGHLEPGEKKALWEEISKTLAQEKERYVEELKEVDLESRERCHQQVKDIQSEYEHLIKSFTENLKSEFDEAIGLSFHLSDAEFEEIMAQVDLMVPIDIRGLTEEERALLGKQKTDMERLVAEIPWFIEETATESVEAILLPPGSEGALNIVKSLSVNYVDREVARKEYMAQGLEGEELENAVNAVARPFNEVLEENWIDAVFCIVSLLPVSRFVGKAGQQLIMKSDGQVLKALRELGGPAWELIEKQIGAKLALSAAKEFIEKNVSRTISKAGNMVIGATAQNETLNQLK